MPLKEKGRQLCRVPAFAVAGSWQSEPPRSSPLYSPTTDLAARYRALVAYANLAAPSFRNKTCSSRRQSAPSPTRSTRISGEK